MEHALTPHIQKRLLYAIGISGFFLFLDQVCKYLVRQDVSFAWYIIDHIFGWEYFANPGVAFGIPIPNTVIIILTPLLLFGLLYYFIHTTHTNCVSILGGSLIILGAISNFIDRVLFGVTIDYIRIFTSVANIADGMIIAGVLLFLYDQYIGSMRIYR
ncbi:MAG: signal peptidase II [Candidatus Magasanikbacteria bacterium]|nr:signal peptidase II [Candidatus Magasanikbacteria bacterium]